LSLQVQYCIIRDIPFLAQNGGHGSSATFTLQTNGVIINLAQLNQVSFNEAKTEVTLQGGALVGDVVAAAYANRALVSTPTCDCIGLLGAGLGGGFGNLVGIYGLVVDNLISVNMVTPSGTAITVTPQDADLWWAFRGAGPNFGIVTSASMRSYPVDESKLSGWMGSLTFSEDKLEELVQTMDNLFLQPEMAISLVFAASGDANNATILIIASLFYYGTETAGRAAFSSLYALGPVTDDTGVLPYNMWNAGNVGVCIEGQRKQMYGAGTAHMVASTWRELYNEYKTFIQQSGAVNSAVIMNADPMVYARSIPDSSSSYPFRSTINFLSWAQTWYADPSLDAEARSWGFRSRDLLRSTSGLAANST
jgi:FAD/FMN-containing dehydrogenase